MTSAESIVKEYLERGYSLESLRLLAESREQPLGAEMLAVIERIERDAEVVACEEDSGPCETAAYPVTDADPVFFIADDESGMCDADGIDFDVMAGTAPVASTEESVADVLVGFDAEASAGPAVEAMAASLGQEEKQGLWTKLWTRVASASTPSAQYGPYAVADENEGVAAKADSDAVLEEAVAAESEDNAHAAIEAEEIANEIADEQAIQDVPEAVEEAAIADEGDAAASASEPEAVADEPVSALPESGEVVPETEEAVASDTDEMDAMQSDASVDDYLPGAVSAIDEMEEAYDRQRVEEEMRRLLEAQQALSEQEEDAGRAVDENAVAENEIVAENVVEENAAASEETIHFAADAAPEAAISPVEEAANAPAEVERPAAASSRQTEAKKSTRRERRRMRALKKKEKRAAIKAAAELSEIVMVPAKETEPQSVLDEHGTQEFSAVETDVAEEAALLPAPVAEELVAESGDESLRMSEPMTLLTPNDLIDHDSRSLDEVASTSVAYVDDAVEQADDGYAAGGDHLMILANGGVELENAEDAETEASEERNVILFREMFPAVVSEDDGGDDAGDDEDMPAAGLLHVVPPVEDDAEEMVAAPQAQSGEQLTEEARAGLLRMICGSPEPEDAEAGCDEVSGDADEHNLIVSLEPELTIDDLVAREAASRLEIESEYQMRLDEFAARLLDVQTAGAISESKLAEKQAELDARAAVLDEMKTRIEAAEAREKELLAQVQFAGETVREKEREVSDFKGMREEHQRLYNEFEDLRKAYNEVVTDVMPGLQRERDDLALTVERQCGAEKELRSSLGSTRRRLAVGYSLGTAAAVMFIALPAANWISSSGHDKELAIEHQKVSELRENLKHEIEQNINSGNRIAELENKVKMARVQINQLQDKNQELVRVQQDASKNGAGLAVFKPSESGVPGVPTRASTMALQAAAQPGGKLRVNEVRDPAGSIEQVVADNRERNAGGAAQMASAGQARSAAIPLSGVARADSRNGQAAPKTARQNADSAAAKPVAGEGEVLATVKAGEGVAQVVYRQLGTWDPEVVRWVIQENKIKKDRRGNPVIHPNQVLRLPKDGRVGQAASARRR